MSDEARQRLLAATRHAAEVVRTAVPAGEPAAGRGGGRKDGGADGPPAPGDLYALAATAGHAVEWLVAARHEAQPRRLLLVPADADPWVGSADLEVPAQDGGPLVLHCRHALWIDAAALAGGHRGGRLEASWGDAAAERWGAVEAGTHRGSPLERETDDDPEYRDRNRELAAAAAALAALSAAAEHARQASRFRNPLSSVPLLRAVAALLLAALLGVGWWAVDLQRRLAEPPRLLLHGTLTDQIVVGDPLRAGPEEVRLAPGDSYLLLDLAPVGRYPSLTAGYRWRIVDESGREVWSADGTGRPSAALFVVPADLLAPGLYRLQLVDPQRRSSGILEEKVLLLVSPDSRY